MDNLAQGLTLIDRIKFLLVHMLQMELLVVLLCTALAALFLYFVYQKQGNRRPEQVFSRNLAAAATSTILLLWLAGRILR